MNRPFCLVVLFSFFIYISYFFVPYVLYHSKMESFKMIMYALYLANGNFHHETLY